MKKQPLILALILYLISSVVSYAAFSKMGGISPVSVITDTTGPAGTDDVNLLAELLDIDPNEAVDQPCPLNGKMFTNTEKEVWEKRRPLFVMIENSVDARPHSGLNNADIIFEAIAEGGVTRFGAIFYCDAQSHDVTIAPVRSARTYFVDWASGFNLPLYVHVGGANVPGKTNALGQINDYGWNMQNDLNQFSIGYPTFVRNYSRIEGKELATEHTMETTSEKLWAVGEEREWTNMSPDRKYGRKTIEGEDWKEGFEGWTFEEETGEKGNNTKVSYDFWSGYNDYSVTWKYDSDSDLYLRFHGDKKHIDLNTDKQVVATNVVVILTKETGPINEVRHMLYATTGTGKALVFKHGQAIEATWSKKSREAELKLLDSKGKDLELARGLTWISVMSKTNEVDY